MRMATNNSTLKPQVVLPRIMQEMREEMDRVWKDFFEKNPDETEVARRWLEGRLRNVQDSKDHAGEFRSRSKTP